ncbi:MAG TPA: ATP synthase F0 subunit B [Bacteriovoracaceae bacterium]|nr:ATP synthase F0 subunit B [Bacteriovoracaceae bacterium]
MITTALAAGGGDGHGSVTDLIAPAINVGILLGVLIWKVKGPLETYFVGQSEEISNTLERASLKSKEAQIMIESEERKAANINTEIKNIHQYSENDVMIFEKKLSKETEEKSVKLKVDANSRIGADKKAMMDELNGELLSQVISKTKSTIKNNKEYQTKVSAKLLQRL